MSLTLELPLWPVAVVISILFISLVLQFVLELLTSGKPHDHRMTFGERVVLLVTVLVITAGLWVIWFALGYPVAAQYVAAGYALFCARVAFNQIDWERLKKPRTGTLPFNK